MHVVDLFIAQTVRSNQLMRFLVKIMNINDNYVLKCYLNKKSFIHVSKLTRYKT